MQDTDTNETLHFWEIGQLLFERIKERGERENELKERERERKKCCCR